MPTNQTYAVAISRFPNVIRRTAREASGELVLGFAFTRVPVNAYMDHISCEMLNAGDWCNDAVIKSALDTLCTAFGEQNICQAVEGWLRKKYARASVPVWTLTQVNQKH